MTRFQVGNATVERVEEVLEHGFEPSFLLPGFDPALFDEHPETATPNFYDRGSGRVVSSIHSWLIHVGGRTVLVDTCSGNGKTRALPLFQRFHMLDLPYLDTLGAAGVRPEDVDLVVCTHLHVDHVGWNTRRAGADDAWVPTFPNARYLFGRAEHAHWTTGGGPEVFPENVDVIADSVTPVVEAGLAEFLDPGDEILPGLTVEAAPGHTPTQLVVKYDDGTGAFIVTADVLHQPVQVCAPHLSSCFCEDPAAAAATRRRILGEAAERGALILPMHFGPPHGGHVRRANGGHRFMPATPAEA